jgi:ketosteroid isomerase-like protein
MTVGDTKTTDLEVAVNEFYGTMSEFARGDSGPAKALCSHSDDMVLANPFGPAVRGWGKVQAAMDYAASRFSEGKVSPSQRIATYMPGDLAVIHEAEHWKTRVGGGELTPFDLRVTSVYRQQDGEWRLVLRHADPISTGSDQGPIRTR